MNEKVDALGNPVVSHSFDGCTHYVERADGSRQSWSSAFSVENCRVGPPRLIVDGVTLTPGESVIYQKLLDLERLLSALDQARPPSA